MKRLIAAAVLLVAVPVCAPAQESDHLSHGQGYAFLGGAWSRSQTGRGESSNSFQFGGGGEWLSGHGVGLGGEYLKSAQSLNGGYYLDTRIGSANVSYHFGPSRKSRQVEPFVTGGLTVFNVIETDLGREYGGNFGGGVEIWMVRHAALRLEVRDDVGGRDLSAEFVPIGVFYLRSSQHLVGVRIGVSFR